MKVIKLLIIVSFLNVSIYAASLKETNIINIAIADFLYCNAGVKIYYSNHSASLQQSNGTRANFEYSSIDDELVVYRGTDIAGRLGIPIKIQGTVKVLLELDGKYIPFRCHK